MESLPLSLSLKRKRKPNLHLVPLKFSLKASHTRTPGNGFPWGREAVKREDKDLDLGLKGLEDLGKHGEDEGEGEEEYLLLLADNTILVLLALVKVEVEVEVELMSKLPSLCCWW